MGVPNQRHPNDPQEESRPPEVSPELVLAHLATLSEPASIRQIAHGMELKHHGRRFLPRVLHRLKKSGDVEETRGGRYKLPGAKETQKAATKRKDRESAAAKTAAQGRSENQQPTSSPPSKRGHDPNLIPGRIVAHREGYAFLVPDSPIRGIDGDLFIGRDNLGDAMNGDRVLGRVERRRPDGRAEGRVVQIVERVHPTLVGLFRYGPQGNVVLPYDTRILHEVLIPPGDELTPALREKLGPTAENQPLANRRVRLPELDGAVVDVEIRRYPKGGLAPVGRVVEILGRPGEIGVDVEIIIRKHHLPHVFDAEVLEQARSTEQQVSAADLRGRRDFRDLPIVTIDGETARDFDDAVLVRPLPNGNYELQVHIADVSHYVRPGTSLDLEARLRGTSVYFPDRAIPMLPPQLSSGMCSLRPDEDRLVLSCLMEIDARGEVLGYEVCEGIIRSAKRMTYTQIQGVLDGNAETRAEFAELVPEFERMYELALKLNAKRHRRGSIDFDLPEPVIQFDPDGNMEAIVRSQRGWAHRLIEEFMLSANECVATWIESQDVAGVYRIHEVPDPKRIVDFEETASQFGYSLGFSSLPVKRIQTKGDRRDARGTNRSAKTHEVAESIPVTPQMYQRLTAKIAGKAEERILSYLMLRSLKQARYSEENVGHFALASPSYTQDR